MNRTVSKWEEYPATQGTPGGVSQVWQTKELQIAILEVWQLKDLEASFSDLWQLKGLACFLGEAGICKGGEYEARIESEWQQKIIG